MYTSNIALSSKLRNELSKLNQVARTNIVIQTISLEELNGIEHLLHL